MNVRGIQVLRHVALYALVGPPIGGLTVLLWSTFVGQPSLPFELGTWLFVMFPAAFVLGGVPALVTGVVAAYVRAEVPGATRSDKAIRIVAPMAAGALFSVAFSLATIASEPSLLLAAVGALSALACTLLLERRSPVWPNSSSKPTPLRGAA